MASGIVHLIASTMLFGKQNQAILDNLGKHPVTVGIAVPGNEFVSRILSLLQNAGSADGSGWDQRANLSVMRIIRDVRKEFLPEWAWAAVDLLYDQIYAGDVVVCGVVYQILHMKSGWLNTWSDGSLLMWLTTHEAIFSLTGKNPDDICVALINIDDLVLSNDRGEFTMDSVRDYLGAYNVRLELESEGFVEPRQCVFLSHRLIERFVRGLGDCIVAAGNEQKLLSSVQWVRHSSERPFYESVVLHLLGLRICLWPWAIHFAEVEGRLDSYLTMLRKAGDLTPSVESLLRARIPETVIRDIHFGTEGV